MQWDTLIKGVLVLCVALPEGRSFAQSTDAQIQTQTPSEASVVYVPRGGYAYTDYDLQEAKRQSRVMRNALIGTSAGFALGVILAGIGASQCTQINNRDEWICNNAGDVLLPLGGTFAALGAIGMITTGIMLGVRNKHKREIERDIRRRYGSSRFRWDEKSSRFVF
jgi:hypothetical protein